MAAKEIASLSSAALLFKCYLLTKGKHDKYVYHEEGRSKPFQAGHKGLEGERDTRDWFETLEGAVQHVRVLGNRAKAEDAKQMLSDWRAGKYPPEPEKKFLKHYNVLKDHFDQLLFKEHAQPDQQSLMPSPDLRPEQVMQQVPAYEQEASHARRHSIQDPESTAPKAMAEHPSTALPAKATKKRSRPLEEEGSTLHQQPHTQHTAEDPSWKRFKNNILTSLAHDYDDLLKEQCNQVRLPVSQRAVADVDKQLEDLASVITLNESMIKLALISSVRKAVTAKIQGAKTQLVVKQHEKESCQRTLAVAIEQSAAFDVALDSMLAG